jgi:uncharacterized protein YbjQ (UPF0145 family)
MEFLFKHFEIVLSAVLITIGFFAGRFLEKKHYISIRQREKELRDVLTFATRYPPNLIEPQDCALVTGAVVISSDYFKQFVAGLRNLVGGRFRGYETLFDRARREAILRMKQDAKQQGYKLIVNVKVETTSISGGQQGAMPSFEICAYGTALRPEKTRFSSSLNPA